MTMDKQLMSDVVLGYCKKCGAVIAEIDKKLICPTCKGKLEKNGIVFEKPPVRK